MTAIHLYMVIAYLSFHQVKSEIISDAERGSLVTPPRPRTQSPSFDSGSHHWGSTIRPDIHLSANGKPSVRTTQPSSRQPTNPTIQLPPEPMRVIRTTEAWEGSTRRPTQLHPNIHHGRIRGRGAPKVNVTAGANKGLMRPTPEDVTIALRNGPLHLTFTCNASYPIEWLCEEEFETTEWEIDEYRYSEGSNALVKNKYSIVLRLRYIINIDEERSTGVPPAMGIHCSDKQNHFQQSVVKVSRAEGSTVINLRIENDFRGSWPARNNGRYGGNTGNPGCDKKLSINEYELECRSSKHKGNLSISSVDDCYDRATCDRFFTRPVCGDLDDRSWPTFTSKHTKYLLMRLNEGTPEGPVGIAYCKNSGEHNSKSSGFQYVHSLPKLCQKDEESSRRQLYTGKVDGTPPDVDVDDNILERDFVSFCFSSELLQDRKDISTSLYVGDNITVVCTASLYFFTFGTQIGQYLYENQTIVEIQDQLNVMSSDEIRAQGHFNFTANIQLKYPNVTELFCKNYKKQSTDFIIKTLPIVVKTPKNITFEGSTSEKTSYIYNGVAAFNICCEAYGEPAPSGIEWKKGDRAVPGSLRIVNFESGGGFISSLVFPSTRHTKGINISDLYGQYTCKATNRLKDSEAKTFTVAPKEGDWVEPVPDPVVPDEHHSIWYVWAIIVPLVALIVAGIIGFLVWTIKKQSQELRLLSKAEVDEFIFGRPEFLQHHSSSEEVNNYAPFLPYNKGYEIDKEQFEIDANAILGTGAYAVVLRGTLSHRGEVTKVAIKTGKPMDDVSYFKALLSELKIMGFIGTHPNIVNLVGAYTKNIQNREIYIAIEFCENGSLLAFMRGNRQQFTNQVSKDGKFLTDVLSRDSFMQTGTDTLNMNTIMLIRWAHEIANGMEFLSQKKVIHGDLAARNILLNEYLVAKIGDFGLSRQLFEYANYIKKEQSPLPWKWLAIECLQDMKFSVKSDVWAYSILLFEIFTLGQVAYPGHSYNDEFLDALVNGKRPNKPVYATTEIYELMSCCWKENPEDRPQFGYIKDFFSKMISELVPPEYLELYEKINNESGLSPPSSTLPITETPDLSTVDQISAPPTSPHPIDYRNEDGWRSRFSFNTKTITALFHRN